MGNFQHTTELEPSMSVVRTAWVLINFLLFSVTTPKMETFVLVCYAITFLVPALKQSLSPTHFSHLCCFLFRNTKAQIFSQSCNLSHSFVKLKQTKQSSFISKLLWLQQSWHNLQARYDIELMFLFFFNIKKINTKRKSGCGSKRDSLAKWME